MTVTTKGLSTFSNLTLGKPAAIFDFNRGGEKFGLRFSAHPAYSFKTIAVVQNVKATEILRAQQFLAGEIAPVFKVAENISL